MNAYELIADIRDLIGDPSYDANGNPQPAADGTMVRAQTLVRWINQAQSIIGQELKNIVDWTAFPSTTKQDVYPIDPRFFDFDGGLLYYDGILASGPQFDTDQMLVQSMVTGVSLSWSISRTIPPLQIRLFPAANRTAGSSTLTGNIGLSDTTFSVVNASGFGFGVGGPAYGWLIVGGNELCTYQSLSANTFSQVARGQGGTKPLSHNTGASVQEANIWLKGFRLPTPIGLPLLSQTIPNPVLADSGWIPGSYSLTLTDTMELPDYCWQVVSDWCVHRFRIKENDEQAARAILDMFERNQKRAGKAKRRPRIGQAKLPDSGPGLWAGRVIVR